MSYCCMKSFYLYLHSAIILKKEFFIVTARQLAVEMSPQQNMLFLQWAGRVFPLYAYFCVLCGKATSTNLGSLLFDLSIGSNLDLPHISTACFPLHNILLCSFDIKSVAVSYRNQLNMSNLNLINWERFPDFSVIFSTT
jgi:hypothetical protein